MIDVLRNGPNSCDKGKNNVPAILPAWFLHKFDLWVIAY